MTPPATATQPRDHRANGNGAGAAEPGRRGKGPRPAGARHRGSAAIRREARLRERSEAGRRSTEGADARRDGDAPEQGAPAGARERLIASGAELLSDLGYEALTVTAVRERAGLSTQAFYDYFADKRALVAAVYGPDLEEVDLRLRSLAADRSPTAEPLAEAFEETLERLHRSPSTPKGRLLDAMIEIAGLEGVEAVTLPRLCEAAGVTRGIFYRHFADRRDCLAKATELLLERIEDGIREATEDAEDPCERITLALASLCDWLADDPRTARVVLVEEGALSGSTRRLADLVCSELEASFPESPEAAHRTASGGVVSLLRSELTTAGARTLPELAPELTFAALAPLTGSERALAQMDRARCQGAADSSTPTPEPAPAAHHPHLPTRDGLASPRTPEPSTTTAEAHR